MSTEISIRLGFFFGIFFLVAICENLAPRRVFTTSRARRWFANLVIIALNPLSVALVYPIMPVGVAKLAADHQWGFLNQLALPDWLDLLMGVVLLDFAVYVQHVMFHAIPAFWRLHMMHHADLDFDLTTGLRFHPIEIIISMAIKLSAVAALGASPMSVLIFEVVLNATAIFSHSNLRIPEHVDRVLRLIMVTPDMHRVHHSVVIRETNSNYGFNLPWWDRLLGTYKAQPDRGHTEMVIGLSQFRDPQKLSLHQLLILPFAGDPGRVPINRH